MQIFFWSTTFCFFFLLSVSKRATSELQNPGSNSTEDERHPASVSVECREPLLGSASWECAIGERELPPKSPEEDGAWELLEGIDGDNGENGTAMNSNQSVAVQAGPLAVYHSFKVNRTTGRLFISALLRWEFQSQRFHAGYQVQLWVHDESDDAASTPRLFLIPLAPFGNSSAMARQRRRIQRVELTVRLDGLFAFGHSYRLKIAAALPASNSTKSRPLAVADKQIHFAEMVDEFDTDACANNNINYSLNSSSPEAASTRRREFAARWTGAFRTVAFFPLHSAINVSFFGAPPSLCIPGFRLQLWLMNALMQEQKVTADQLVRVAPGTFVGSAEFRDLLRSDDQRLKYRLKLVPIERREDGTCVCQLADRCDCVDVVSEPFAMLNASAALGKDADLLGFAQIPIANLEEAEQQERTMLPFLVAALLLALTLVMLSCALLLLVVRQAGRVGTKRRTLLLFRKSQSEHLGLVSDGSRKSQSGGAVPKREIQSILLLNAQPAKCAEVERFARLLVKNGVRIFYDRWDQAKIERNLMVWVHQAINKADRAILFWDQRAEQLLMPSSEGRTTRMLGGGHEEDLFDRVFCALHQQLDPHKTIYVQWDESSGTRPLGAITETVFSFRRDLRLIYAALQVPTTDAELRDIQLRFGRPNQQASRPESLVVVVPKKISEKRENGEEDQKKPLLAKLEEKHPVKKEVIHQKLEEGLLDEAFTNGGKAQTDLTMEKAQQVAILATHDKQTGGDDQQQLDSGIETGVHAF